MRAMANSTSWGACTHGDDAAAPDVTSGLEAAAALAEQHHAECGAVRPEREAEAVEHLCLAGEGQPGAAGGGAQRADLLRDGEPALDELDDLGVAGVDLVAQGRDAVVSRGGCGGGGHGGSFAFSEAVGSGNEKRPGLS